MPKMDIDYSNTDTQSIIQTTYGCETCNYNTCNKKDYNKHLLTAKHNARISSVNVQQIPPLHECRCGSTYKHIQSYNRHKRTCAIDNNDTPQTYIANQPTSHIVDAPLVLELLKQNQEFKVLMMEQSKQYAEQQSKLLEAICVLIENIH